jgi:hypothetical protein
MSNPDRPRLSRAAGRTAGILLLLAGAGCARAKANGAPEHPERLDGAWTMELNLEHPATLTRETNAVPPVRGTVVLLENEEARVVSGASGVPTHYGVYSADVRPLGLGSEGQVPTIAARLVGADSVEIAFEPEQGHGLAGRGVLAGDSVVGRWWTAGGRAIPRSTGRFTLRRP